MERQYLGTAFQHRRFWSTFHLEITHASQPGDFCPPGDIWQSLETFFIVKLGSDGEAATGIQWVEAMQHPTMHRAAAMTISHLHQDVTSAEAGKP